jgi:hypothetical protein
MIKFNKILLTLLISAAFQPLLANAQEAKSVDGKISKDGLPCIPDVCIGDRIDDLNIKFLSVSSISEKLAANVKIDQVSPDKRITRSQLDQEINKATKLIEADQAEEGLTSLVDFAKKVHGEARGALVSNVIWMAMSVDELKKNRPKDKINYAKLVNYIAPVSPPLQPTNDVKSFQEAERHFDSDLHGILAKEKIKFCYPYRMVGFFNSKSGYLTAVSAEPDTDGVYKVSSVRRIIEVPDLRSKNELRAEMLKAYKEFFHPRSDGSSLVSIDGYTEMQRSEVSIKSKKYIDFAMVHPKNMLANDSYDPDHFERWTKGWLALKNKNKFVSLASLFEAQPQCRPPKASMN